MPFAFRASERTVPNVFIVTSLLLSADLRIKQIRRKLPERGGSRSTITLSNVGGLKLNCCISAIALIDHS
jgi:hypothetical protein